MKNPPQTTKLKLHLIYTQEAELEVKLSQSTQSLFNLLFETKTKTKVKVNLKHHVKFHFVQVTLTLVTVSFFHNYTTQVID